MIRLVFFGTPHFAIPFLRALAEDSQFEVAAIVSQPDRPIGRKQVLEATPMKAFAREHGMPVLQPETLKASASTPSGMETIQKLTSLKADIFVVVAYGRIIPRAILDIPKLGCVNVHPSLLPRHRGPSPLQAAIAAGDRETAVSVMKLDEGMDTGPILAAIRFPLASDETGASLEKKVQVIGAPLLVSTLKRYAAGEIQPAPQSTQGITVTHVLTRDDGYIDWSLSAEAIDRKRRAYTPWPGIWTIWNGKRLKLIEAIPFVIASGSKQSFAEPLEPGRVFLHPDSMDIGTGNGFLRVTKLQPEGAKAMDVKAFIHGYKDIQGAVMDSSSRRVYPSFG